MNDMVKCRPRDASSSLAFSIISLFYGNYFNEVQSSQIATLIRTYVSGIDGSHLVDSQIRYNSSTSNTLHWYSCAWEWS